MDAATNNRVGILDLLLKHGADWSLVNNEGFTALHFSAFRNHLASVRRLLETASKNPNPAGFHRFLNQQGKNNRATALRDATSQGHTEVAKLLLQHRADYEICDARGCSPLLHAVRGNNTELFNILLTQLKDDDDKLEKGKLKRALNAKDHSGENIWLGATRRSNQEIMKALKNLRVEIEGM